MNGPAQKFNDDVLAAESDRAVAEHAFPHIMHVLDFPELRELLLAFDAPAKRAKRLRSLVGIVAIACGFAALCGAPVALLYDKVFPEWSRPVAAVSASLGVVSLLLGIVGALSGKSKQRWLSSRLMTERLRQFHFQAFACRLPSILASTRGPKGRNEFLGSRQVWLADFRLAFEGHLPAKLRSTLDDEAAESVWLHPREELAPLPSGPDATLLEVFAAYRVLRLEHQIQYANYRIGTVDGSLFSAAGRQLQWLRTCALSLIFVAFVINVGLAIVLWINPASAPALGGLSAARGGASTIAQLHVFIIWLFVGIAATRTLEEGLQPAREVERFRRYRSVMLSLLKRFDAAADPREKVSIMRDAERVAYQEMRDFLRTHDEASFVL